MKSDVFVNFAKNNKQNKQDSGKKHEKKETNYCKQLESRTAKKMAKTETALWI